MTAATPSPAHARALARSRRAYLFFRRQWATAHPDALARSQAHHAARLVLACLLA